MKVLHISFHCGCRNDLEYVASQLAIDLTFMLYDDGISVGEDRYNITHEKAQAFWEKHADYYQQFDCIITSDTAPISRVFLQNNWSKRLIIWICNRFDYAVQPSTGFPDHEYYRLINDVKNRPNVSIIGYTPFETYYANHIRGLSIGNLCIKPVGKVGSVFSTYTPTPVPGKRETFIIGPYHNDNIMMNLREVVEALGIRVFNGRYNGPRDLAEFAGMIHIPYAWSNLAFFEAIQMQVPMFIPSLSFLKEIKRNREFFWSPPYREEVIELSEWYCPDHRDILVYFDSWKDLQHKTINLDYSELKRRMFEFGLAHEKLMLNRWNILLRGT